VAVASGVGTGVTVASGVGLGAEIGAPSGDCVAVAQPRVSELSAKVARTMFKAFIKELLLAAS
jgi:alcohol dehydrogenase class IV